MEDIISQAARFINTTASHLFLTGKAGTGKTTFLKNLSAVTHKTFIVVAPTGIAALNAGGVTIHSQFLLPPVTFLPDRFLPENFVEGGRVLNQNVLARKHPLNSARKQVLRSIDLLVIDEVSMLRADLLDAIDYRMKAARGNFRQSFGGVQVLFIGDLYQLPPVVRTEEQETLNRYYKSSWFYEAKALQDEPLVYIELDKIFRQHDPEFINILNNLRNNTVTGSDIETLNKHYRSAAEIGQIQEVITLTTHNYKADELNQKELRALSKPAFSFDAFIEGDFPESMYPVLASLELKEGAQIMFVRNDTSEEKKYYNGKLAIVKKIEGDDIWVTMAETHTDYLLKRQRWENKRYTVEPTAHEMGEEVIGSFEQYPVKLAWAITVHKSQGLTFDKAIIDVGQAFADGQVYVALSRLRSLEGLVLRTRLNPAVISTDEQVAAFVKTNHQPGRLGEVMQNKQKIYLQQLINQTFDFSNLVKDINYIQKDQDQETLDQTMKPPLVQLVETIETEKANTEKFRRQLIDLLVSNQSALLLERITKGRLYYRAFLFSQAKILLEHLESIKQQKRVKAYTNQLTELDLALNKKIEEVDKALRLTEAIIQGHEQFDFDALTKHRADERAALLTEIKKSRPTNEPTHKSKPRKGRKSKSETGPSTYDSTLELFKNGMTIDQIAKERGLVVSTIEGHLAKAVETGRLEIGLFINETELGEIMAAIRLLPDEFASKQLYDQLNGKYSYGKLRAVMSHAKTHPKTK